MDFQVLAERPGRPSLLSELEHYITQRKSFLQRRASNPPHLLGVIILMAVVLELTLNVRLLNGLGMGKTIIEQLVLVGAVLLGIEMLLVAITHQASGIFGTTGHTLHLLTFFNIGLFPLLIYLPISFTGWLGGHGEGLRIILMLLLLIQVTSNWRESIEIVYKFSKMQSAIAIYALSGIAFLLIGLVCYAILFNKLAQLFL